MSQIYKKFQKDISAIAYFGLALFIGLSLASFNPQDPSFNTLGHGIKSANFCGLVGSFLADLLFQFFGIVSWALALGSLRLAYKNFKGEEINFRNLRILWGSILVISLASLVALYLPDKKIFMDQIYVG